MRKFFCTLFFAILFGCSLLAQQSAALAVHLSDGSITRFLLDERPVVTFTAAGITVTSSSLITSIRFDDLSLFLYENLSDAIDAVADSEPFIREGELLVFSGLRAGGTVRTYSLGGRLCSTVTCDDRGMARLPLQELPAGLYIIQTDSHTYKIMKR